MFSKKGIALLTIALTVASCAKKQDYKKTEVDGLKGDKNVEKRVSKLEIKDLCSSSEPLLFVPSVGAVPRAVSSARPYELGDAKIVTCDIKKDKIVFNEIENDSRFNVNTNNKSPVFSIDISHIDYKCAEDSYGDCTNKEEEDTAKPWQQRRQINMDIQSVDILAKDINLSLDRSNLLSGCFSEVSKEIHSFKLDKRSLNFTIKKQMSASLECASYIQSAEDIRYAKFYTDYNYSLIKLSDIADPNYKPVNYPKFDQSKFGFFKTEKVNMTTDNLTSVMGTKSYLMNRWSPNKKNITYYLSKHFYDKGMENVLQATKDGIKSVNKSLDAAGAKLQIKLEDGRNVNEGDIKNSFLVLVKDPHASGVIGYGPAIKNPNTGEILSGRTIMYYGTIRKTIARAYDKMLEQSPTIPTKDVVPAGDDSGNNDQSSLIVTSSEAEQQAISMYQNFGNTINELDPASYFYNEGIEDVAFEKSIKQVESNLDTFKKELEEMSEQTFYHESMTNITSVIDSLGIKVRKPWAQLTEAEKSKVIDKMLPYVWIPTLVHEFGHNLGLRHNFFGSTDKANFYTKDEAVDMELNRVPEYSSIMDYAYNVHTELSIMGKYDVAALRFAYARKVDHKTGKVIKVEDSLEKENKEYVSKNIDSINLASKDFATENNIEGDDYESVKEALADLYSNAPDEASILTASKLKEKFEEFTTMKLKAYEYCTDENVNNDALCNRHDEGVGLKGLSEHYVEKYADYYKFRNLRGRKFNFNSVKGDLSYAIYVLSTFSEMRQIFNMYNAYESAGWATSSNKKQKEKYADAKAASDTIFKFFNEVVRKAPQTCMVYLKNESDLSKSQLANIIPLGSNTKYAKMCNAYQDYFKGPRSPAAPEIKEKIVVTSAGSFINNAFDEREHEVSSLISQIDVRGIGIDKVMAMNMLTTRDSSIVTGFSSFLDIPRYKKEVLGLIGEVINNKMVGNLIYNDLAGNTFSRGHMYNIVNTHSLSMSYNNTINGFLGLYKEENDIRKPMIRMIKQNLKRNSKGSVMLDDLTVYTPPRNGDISRFDYDAIVEFQNEAGFPEVRYGAYKYNRFAMYLISIKPVVDALEALTEEQRQMVAGFAQGAITMDKIPDESVLKLVKENADIAKDFGEGYISKAILKKTFKSLAQ